MSHFARNYARILTPLTATLAFAILFILTASPAFAASHSQAIQEPTILVHFNEGTSAEARAALIAEMDGELVAWILQLNVAEIRLGGGNAASAASLPADANGIVSYAEANLFVSGTYEPTDPDFSDNTMSYGFEQIQAPEAWDIVTGSQEIVIAVVDSGIKLTHPEFEGRLVDGYDFVNRDAVADDDSGHGTHVAGIIGAALDNGQGVAGVCPNCRLMPVKVLNKNNLGSWSQLAQGIVFAVDHGARIINLSLGASVSSETLAAAIEYAIHSGVIVVAAAGNYGSDELFYPAALEGVIAVGATNGKSKRWSKSDYGSYIDLVAPGELIYSTYYNLDNIYHGYTYMSGTSMAAPFVSGVAGLILSVAPALGAEDATEALMLGAMDLGPEGKDDEFGNGRVNAWGALQAPVEGLVEAVGEITGPTQQLTIYLPVLSSQ
jgi:thermitase